MCPEVWGLETGAAQMGGQPCSCSSNWCGLCLGLWSLLELWGTAGHREDNEVAGVGSTLGEQDPVGSCSPASRRVTHLVGIVMELFLNCR